MPLENPAFPVTERILAELDEWLSELAAPLVPLKMVPAGPPEDNGFRWAFREESERALVIGKSVRMISAIKAAFILMDQGYVTEAGTLLRTVSDFASEITSITEGVRSGSPTAAQKKFLEQYFAPIPEDPDEYDARKKEQFVTRDQLLSAEYRLAEELWKAKVKDSPNPDRVRRVVRYLPHMYDKYVHGAYITAMELYNGDTWRFMVSGHESVEYKYLCKTQAASKLHEAIVALCWIAVGMGMTALVEKIQAAQKELYDSGELSD
jgi:hypothetical protein